MYDDYLWFLSNQLASFTNSVSECHFATLVDQSLCGWVGAPHHLHVSSNRSRTGTFWSCTGEKYCAGGCWRWAPVVLCGCVAVSNFNVKNRVAVLFGFTSDLTQVSRRGNLSKQSDRIFPSLKQVSGRNKLAIPDENLINDPIAKAT